MLSEKNACPIALRITDEVILLKSGWTKNVNPSLAFGKVTERIARMSKNKKRSGIIILDARSIPDFTPDMMMT